MACLPGLHILSRMRRERKDALEDSKVQTEKSARGVEAFLYKLIFVKGHSTPQNGTIIDHLCMMYDLLRTYKEVTDIE